MCSSAKYIFVYDINTAYFLIYDWVFKVTKVYWRFLLMNPLFHHASSAILLPWILANNEGGAHVLIQVLQWEKETRVKELNIFNPSRELPSKRMLTLNQIIWYVLEVTCGWAVHFALLCCNYILLSAGKVSQLSTSLEQKSACCHFSSLPRCHCQFNFLLGSWMFSVSSDSSHHLETNFSYFLYLLYRMGKCGLFWTFMVPLRIRAKANEVLIFSSKYPLQYTDFMQLYKLIIEADRMLRALWIAFQCGCWLCGWLRAWDKKIVKCGKVIITYVL